MLFKRNIVEQNPFPVGRYHEDDFTMFKYFEQAKRVCIVPAVGYYYMQHDSSIMHTKSEAILKDEMEAADNLTEYFKSKDAKLYKAALSKKFSNYCQILIQNPRLNTQAPETYRTVCEFLNAKKWPILYDKDTRLKNKLAALTLIVGPRFMACVGSLGD